MKKNVKKIPDVLYRQIVDTMPILCVDVVVIEQKKYLLGKRKNKPEKGTWWVPGGRVLKGETLHEAVHRKIKEELGISVRILKSLGYFEGLYQENEYGLKSGTHGVSIVFLVVPKSLDIRLDKQSSAWRLSSTLPKNFNIKPFSL